LGVFCFTSDTITNDRFSFINDIVNTNYVTSSVSGTSFIQNTNEFGNDLKIGENAYKIDFGKNASEIDIGSANTIVKINDSIYNSNLNYAAFVDDDVTSRNFVSSANNWARG
jgi:hypothetical protein